MSENNLPSILRNKFYIWGLVCLLIVIALVCVVVFYRTDKITSPNQQVSREDSKTQLQSTPEGLTQDASPVVGEGNMTMRSDSLALLVGKTVRVKILVDTKGKNINLAQSVVTFDPSITELVSIDSSKSDFSIKVEESITPGSVTIIRGEPGDGVISDTDDGFTGEHGVLVELVFKGKKAGTSSMHIDSVGSVLYLDDGRGSRLSIPDSIVTFSIK